MEFHVIERLRHRLLADPAFHYFHAVLIAHDARLLGAAAHGFDQLGRPPMGMHVDHVSLLSLSSDGLSPLYATVFANSRAIYSNRRGETSVFPAVRQQNIGVRCSSSLRLTDLNPNLVAAQTQTSRAGGRSSCSVVAATTACAAANRLDYYTLETLQISVSNTLWPSWWRFR